MRFVASHSQDQHHHPGRNHLYEDERASRHTSGGRPCGHLDEGEGQFERPR